MHVICNIASIYAIWRAAFSARTFCSTPPMDITLQSSFPAGEWKAPWPRWISASGRILVVSCNYFASQCLLDRFSTGSVPDLFGQIMWIYFFNDDSTTQVDRWNDRFLHRFMINWLIWIIHPSIDRSVDWLIDCWVFICKSKSIHWLIDWLIDLLHFSNFSELYPGWISHWGRDFSTVPLQPVLSATEELLTRNASFTYYPFVGGTNFGFTVGSNVYQGVFSPGTTSYDFDATVSEAGDLTEKYWKLRDVFKKVHRHSIPVAFFLTLTIGCPNYLFLIIFSNFEWLILNGWFSHYFFITIPLS